MFEVSQHVEFAPSLQRSFHILHHSRTKIRKLKQNLGFSQLFSYFVLLAQCKMWEETWEIRGCDLTASHARVRGSERAVAAKALYRDQSD